MINVFIITRTEELQILQFVFLSYLFIKILLRNDHVDFDFVHLMNLLVSQSKSIEEVRVQGKVVSSVKRQQNMLRSISDDLRGRMIQSTILRGE